MNFSYNLIYITKMTYYIVYSYKINYNTKYIEGIYDDINLAIKRQQEICGENATPSFNSIIGSNGIVCFINTIPNGPVHVEVFTT